MTALFVATYKLHSYRFKTDTQLNLYRYYIRVYLNQPPLRDGTMIIDDPGDIL